MTRPISRQRYLEILQAALAAQHYRFARQAALDWLAFYPGDLSVSLCYARALMGEGRLAQAIGILQGLRRADPEYLEAVEALAAAGLAAGGEASLAARSHYQALTGLSYDTQALAPWGQALWSARQALEQGSLEQDCLERAGALIGGSLREAPNLPLAGVLHLQYLGLNQLVDLRVRREAALGYHQRWPDCIACMLWLAQWSLECGEADYGVALLHQAASRDLGGQVAERLWGAQHPYRRLWPERLELPLSLPIPADVAARLGDNRLAAGDGPEPAAPPEPPSKGLTWSGGATAAPSLGCLPEDTPPGEAASDAPCQPAAALQETAQASGLEWALAEADAADASKITSAAAPVARSHRPDTRPLDTSIWNPIDPPANAAAGRAASPAATGRPTSHKNNGSKPSGPLDAELNSVSQELDRLARRLKAPAVGRQDGRFPVYVIFSVQSRLEAVYGKRIADLLLSQMQALAEAVTRRKGWVARLFLPDSPAWLHPLGLRQVRAIDPWELKLALVDLDARLAQRGERIGAVLIVGGPEIVPFHHLPNPVEDQDEDIPTDNPYATRDENYFIPEWPVGRLPGGQGQDARLLLEALQRLRLAHEAGQGRVGWLQRLSGWLRRQFRRPVTAASPQGVEIAGQPRAAAAPRPSGRKAKSFGYTAAIWKQAAWLVFRPIGKPAWLSVSPPFGIDGAAPETAGKIPSLRGKLAYFNLHGLVDAPDWYGQRDPLGNEADPDYPVALRPQDILLKAGQAAGEIPQVVFSEACYGLHIHERGVEQAISLSFLQAGTLAVVGSTCMAYGSIEAPLAAADLLGHTFWRYLQQGFPAGEALRQAKIHLASRMSQSQGYLDGEDQKTLISFILYGDPLAQPFASEQAPKTLRYQTSALARVPTMCERLEAADLAEPVPAEVLASVRRVVAHHLPGMSDARLTLVHPRPHCPGEGHTCATSQQGQPQAADKALPSQGRKRRRNLLRKAKNAADDSCSLVTLSKQVTLPNGVHPRVARLTLDERGHLVKLVVSR